MGHRDGDSQAAVRQSRFRETFGFDLPPWTPNLPEHRQASQNPLFSQLAGWAFDWPERLGSALEAARRWAGEDPGPPTWELLGYLQYLSEDWGGAARSFMRSLEVEPRNLDSWFCLAFCLKHLGIDLGESILFDHDVWARLLAAEGGPLSLSRLDALRSRVEAEPDCYRRTWPGAIAPYLTGR